MQTFGNDLMTGAPTLLYTITRVDGTVERVTAAARDITIGGLTWSRLAGLRAGVRTTRVDGTPPRMGFWAQLGGSPPLRLRDVARGLYEKARVEIDLTSQRSPAIRDFVFDGFMLGEPEWDATGVTFFDLISLYAVPRDLFVPKFTLMCRHQFGDWRNCHVAVFPTSTFPHTFPTWLSDPPPRNWTIAGTHAGRYRFDSAGTPEDFRNVYLESPTGGITAAVEPTFTSTVGDVIIDGTVTWVVRNAWARAARVAAVNDAQSITLDRLPDPRAAGNSAHFDPLKFWFATGEYKNRGFKGAAWDSDTLTLQTYLPCPLVAVGDWIEITPDCNKTLTACARFGATQWHGGFPYQQGAKAQAQQLGLG